MVRSSSPKTARNTVRNRRLDLIFRMRRLQPQAAHAILSPVSARGTAGFSPLVYLVLIVFAPFLRDECRDSQGGSPPKRKERGRGDGQRPAVCGG